MYCQYKVTKLAITMTQNSGEYQTTFFIITISN